MEKNGAGVRKGAWTKEEDTLLKNCIQKFGEGKWHKVPPRAGLNRCRKSCRLRWLNYLRPNLNRGCFTKDEVDLLLRLHKLLGNRWSLIAGRLPGRTANDVKNFWNTHILKKKTIDTENNIIIKPRPRRFTKSDVPDSSLSKPDTSKNDCVEFRLTEIVPILSETDELTQDMSLSNGDGAFMQPLFSPSQIDQKVTEFSSLLDNDVWDLTVFD